MHMSGPPALGRTTSPTFQSFSIRIASSSTTAASLCPLLDIGRGSPSSGLRLENGKVRAESACPRVSYAVATLASPCLDGHGANSSIATAASGSPWRTRMIYGGSPKGSVATRDFRCHSTRDNPCGLYRKLGSDREPLEAEEQP
jgi:hypothetical protein